MALPTSLRLFIDPKAGVAYSSFTGSAQISNPSFYLGDLSTLEIYLVEDTGVANYPRQEVILGGGIGVQAAIGPIDASPTAGHFHLTFGGDTTSNQAFNVTAAALDNDLNALASITAAGGVTVSKVGDNYQIKFNTVGARSSITGDAGALVPLSTVGISVLQEGSASLPEIVLVHLQRNPAGLVSSFTTTSASVANVTTISAWDGTKVIYRVAISPDPKGGTFSLTFDADAGTDVSTNAIQIGANSLEVQNALSVGALEDAGSVIVQQVGAYAYDITITVEPAGGLTANSSGLLSFNGFVGDLDLNNSSAIALLDGAESVDTTFEVEISSGGNALTILQIPCTLHSAVIDESAVGPLLIGTPLTQAVADGLYARTALNLSDVTATTARTNLDVYSKTEVDALVAGGGGGGSFLPLSGGTMSGAIVFDATGGQNITKGTFDTGRSGFNGISLVCSVGYELNWQAGWLTSSLNNGANAYPIKIDSGFGTSLQVWDDATNKGCQITHTAITQTDATYDSETGAWGFGVELTSDTSQQAYIEHNEVRVQNGSGGTSVTPSGITFPDSTTQSTAAVPGITYKQTIALSVTAGGGNTPAWGGSYYSTGFYYPSGGQINTDWVTSGKFKVSVNGYLYSFNYLSSGVQYLNTLDDTSTVSLTGTGETLYLHYDGETSPYPFLIT